MIIQTVAELAACASARLETEADLSALLTAAATLSDPFNPSLALALRMLADMPSEIAADWMGRVSELSARLHPDTDGPAICGAVYDALAQFGPECN